MRLVSAREMQEIDRRTIEGGLVPSLVLMERAGRAAASAVLQHLGAQASSGGPGGRVEVLCGKGNNGGDGLVVARLLDEHGIPVRVHLTHPPESLSPDARVNHRKLGGGVEVRLIPESLPDIAPVVDPRERPSAGGCFELPAELTSEVHDWMESLGTATVCVDALLGTGVTDRLQGRLAAIVDATNRCSRYTLAVDIPSGVDGDTGRVHGTAIWADRTVTIGLPKIGLVLEPGRERAGQIDVADIGFPPGVVDDVAPRREWVDAECARQLLPSIDPQAHKYDRGCVVVLAGSRGFTGAAALAAMAALRTGAGIVHLVVPASLQTLLQQKTTEVIVHGVAETPEGTLAPQCEAALAPLLERADALAVGSGFGPNRTTLDWIEGFLARLALPAVIDADAIAALSGSPHPAIRIATPHAGELTRWTGERIGGALDRLDLAARTATGRQLVVLAKGAPTFVAAPDGRLWVNSSGHVGLATAGSGDVLTGMIAALLGAGCGAAGAAALGAYLHGRAAEIASRGRAARSLVAGDLLDSIGIALFELESPSTDRLDLLGN